ALPLAEADLNEDLARRQRGYGRGGRMKIERDQVHISGGVRWGLTLGSPIALTITNRDWENWKATMSVGPPEPGAAAKQVTRPRPGHADLAGAMKYGHRDIRNVLERSSARETTARVVVALGCPVGLGSYVQWDRRLDGRIAQALCAIQAIKGVEFGLGFETARRPGSQVHDEILLDAQGGFRRASNNAGGLEGGVTNGQPVVVRAAMKPLSTLRTPLRSVDVATKEAVEAVVERSDVSAVPAAGVVGEAMLALALVTPFIEKF